jgi:hypothetical protein
LCKRQFSVSFITILGSKVGLHFRRPARMGSSTLHEDQWFFFWQQSEGRTSVGWCIYGGSHSHLLEKGLCRQKKKPNKDLEK